MINSKGPGRKRVSVRTEIARTFAVKRLYLHERSYLHRESTATPVEAKAGVSTGRLDGGGQRTEEEGISSISEARNSTARASFSIWTPLALGLASAWPLGHGGGQRRRTLGKELGCRLDAEELTETRAAVPRGAPPTASRLCTAARRMKEVIPRVLLCGCVPLILGWLFIRLVHQPVHSKRKFRSATITCRPLRCAPATGEGYRTDSLNRAQAAVRFEGRGLLEASS